MKQALGRIAGKKFIIAIAVIAGVVGTFIVGAPAAHAEPAATTGIAISPPLFELSANPGDTLSQSIRIDNLTDSSLPLAIDRRDFVPLGEEGQAELTEKATPFSLSNWIKPDQDHLDIPAKSSKTLNFKIAVPNNAEPGGHFGSLVVHTTPHPDGTNTIVAQELGALILLKVAGQAKEKASIVDFSSTKGLWQKGPVAFEARFKNEGNVQVKPTGTITISNFFGKKVGSISVDSRTVLPESIRKMRGSWQGSGWPGWYTATLSLSYGTNNQLLTSSTKFVIFPYKVIIPIIVILIVLGVLIFFGRKRLGRALRILAGKE